MNSNYSDTPVNTELPARGGHRPLDEDVFQSAQEAVLGGEGAATQTFINNPNRETGESASRPEYEQYSHWSSEEEFFVRARERVEDFVVDEPVKAGLIALALGMLAALVLSRTVRGYRRGH